MYSKAAGLKSMYRSHKQTTVQTAITVTTITQQMQRKEMKFCIIESSRSEVGLLHRVQGSIEATSSVHVLPVVIVMKEWLYISATKSMYITCDLNTFFRE